MSPVGVTRMNPLAQVGFSSPSSLPQFRSTSYQTWVPLSCHLGGGEGGGEGALFFPKVGFQGLGAHGVQWGFEGLGFLRGGVTGFHGVSGFFSVPGGRGSKGFQKF